MSSNTNKVFSVNGMTCQSCVKNIERNVGKIDGVKLVKVRRLIWKKKFLLVLVFKNIFQVSLDEKEANVEFDSDKTTEQAVIDKIKSLGFEAQVK